MTKADLVSQIAVETGFDKKTVNVIVESFAKSIKDYLSNGENVYIRGFGSFITKTRAAKIARNITRETSIAVPAHQIPAFKPAAEFKAVVRQSKK